ncbi:hypothetical protein THZG08_730003 [Vibrio owensii]|nr:hypothetical protein THZG08_730003 [Vibrio owensii]CAH1591329.1 hypothetical protein THOA03_720003 [Vibrio owensii]
MAITTQLEPTTVAAKWLVGFLIPKHSPIVNRRVNPIKKMMQVVL